jgi:hypothetical protein
MMFVLLGAGARGTAFRNFFDHHIPLSDKSLVEALRMVGFRIEQALPKFLP